MYSVNNGTPVTCYFIRDALGDISSVCNATGRIRAEYAYDAYGNCAISGDFSNGFAEENPFRYRGYFYDTETGFYYCQTRHYNPAWGRFISMDSPDYLAPDSVAGMNLYVYCNNDPVNYVDPTGHFAIATGLAIAIGILLGAGTIGGGVIGYIAGKNAGHENLQLFNDVFHGAIAGLIVSELIALLIGTGGAGAPALAVGGMAGEAVALSAEAQILLAVGAITVTGAIETYLHFANDGRPNGNRRQNKQFDDAFREANCNLNERDSFKLRREVHDYIRRHKKDLNFKKLVELFREMAGRYGK